jgi:ATP synthase F1 complex assembly factor 2
MVCRFSRLTCKTIRHISSFYEDTTPQLERLQAEHWDPLFKWVEKTFEVQLNKNTSILFAEQPRETREKLGSVLKNFDQWQMAGKVLAVFQAQA